MIIYVLFHFVLTEIHITGIIAICSLIVYHCMSPLRLGYRELGLELVSLGEDHSHIPKGPPMAKEKRDNRAGDPIKLLLKESLERQMNEMMDSFTQILLRMQQMANAPSTSKRFKDETPFKVQVSFHIPLF